MDILMIGHSRSGKTSYMAGLYKLYGDAPNGFGLWMSDSSKSQKLKHLAANIDKGIYPEGTDIASEYNFWLQYNNSLLVPFIGTTIEVVLYWNQQKILKMLNCWLTELIMQMLLLSF